MKHLKIGSVRSGFKVLFDTRSAQAAVMVLKPGESTEDKPMNEHPRSEQWLYVVSGTAKAIIGKRRFGLRERSLLLIEKGEIHQITNTGRGLMVSLNLYAPPAYSKEGEVLPSA